MLWILFLAFATAADPSVYEKTYSLRYPDAGQVSVLNRCLAAWGDTPFTEPMEKTKVRVIRPNVRVMGIGAKEPEDLVPTDTPQLVLIESAVSVMSRTTYQLLNPNGWYCFQATTNALAQSNINLHCNARLANTHDSTVVLGSDDSPKGDGGVVVLGDVNVRRMDCAE